MKYLEGLKWFLTHKKSKKLLVSLFIFIEYSCRNKYEFRMKGC